ncbi:MAG: hypothetical protein OES33_06860, partial [Desulfobulbaceae bacterium]|nr:hypothetical protein [Desulfobulbaceae bacterium]
WFSGVGSLFCKRLKNTICSKSGPIQKCRQYHTHIFSPGKQNAERSIMVPYFLSSFFFILHSAFLILHFAFIKVKGANLYP